MEAPHPPAAPSSRPSAGRRVPAHARLATAVPARFVMTAGTVATRATAGSAADLPTPLSSAGEAGPLLGEGEVSVPARLLVACPVDYPPAARNAGVEADVPVEVVVDTEGHVVSGAALTRSGYGLDEAALRAMRGYRFSPARRDGRPVRVRMRWTVQFRLE